jgi:hypothetical protein
MQGIDVLKNIIDNPIPFAHSIGYNKLNERLHKDWIRRIYFLKENGTLQAHRGSYKTTCLIISIVLWVISRPYDNLIFLRKSQEDVKEVLTAVSKALQSEIVMSLMKDIYGSYPQMIVDNKTELEVSTYKGVMGRQVLGLGLGSSITGKHGSVLTDDIVTLKDRLSSAERERTKSQYMELINVASEENHKIFNTGTPWHKDDAFTLMPKPEIYTVYETGILSPDRIKERKDGMSGSLFAANYELKHIADGDILFPEPEYGKFPTGIKTFAHIDAAYGGSDGTALTVIGEANGKLHTVGWLMPGHVEDYYQSITSKLERYQVVQLSCETNADKGYLQKELRKITTTPVYSYHEKMNKYYKISTYGKGAWNRTVIDMENSDIAYIAQIMDYNENAQHDDAPDSYSSLIRWKFSQKATVKSSVGRLF